MSRPTEHGFSQRRKRAYVYAELTLETWDFEDRFNHIVEIGGRCHRLVPDVLDQLQGFPKGWTNDGITDGHRAFCMGNAFVVGVPHRIVEIARRM